MSKGRVLQKFWSFRK